MVPSGTAPATPPVHPGSGDLGGALRSLVGQARDLVRGLDPDTVPARQATGVWDLCGELACLFTGAQTLVARRVADAGDYKTAGSRDTAEFLALRSGATKSQTAHMLATSHRLAEQPVTQAAVRHGALSADQAHAIADAAGTDPSQQQRLIDYAQGRSLKELRDETQRTKAAADPTPEATRRRHHDERHFRQGTGTDGRWWFKGQGLPEDRARFEAALNPFIETEFHHARQQGRKEPRDALAYDALQTLARHAHHNLHTTDPDGRPAGSSEPRNAGPGGDDRPQPGDGSQPGESEPSHRTNRDPDNPPGDGDPQGSHPGSDTPQPQQPSDGTANHYTNRDLDNPPDNGDPRSERPGDDTAQPEQPSDGTANHPYSPGDPAADGLQPDTPADPPDGPAPDGSLFGQPVTPKPNSGKGRPKPPGKARRQPNLSLLPVLRIDLAALQRGYLHPGELCEITSNGPLTLTAARELLEESIVKLVLTRHGDVTTVAHLGRASPTPTQLAILHADATALTPTATGVLTGEQTCHIPGIGALDSASARKLLGQLDEVDLLDKVLARSRDVATLVHFGRQPTIAQRTALLWTQPTCSVAGCPHTFTQIDHRHEWHRQNQTELANLDRLCAHHHRLKTHHNYQLTPGTGDRAFVPPEDPRHPNNQSPSTTRDQAPPHAA